MPLYFYSKHLTEADEDEEEWVVEDLLGHRHGPDGNLEFLTRWKGFPPSADSWEPEAHFLTRVYNEEYLRYVRARRLPGPGL